MKHHATMQHSWPYTLIAFRERNKPWLTFDLRKAKIKRANGKIVRATKHMNLRKGDTLILR